MTIETLTPPIMTIIIIKCSLTHGLEIESHCGELSGKYGTHVRI